MSKQPYNDGKKREGRFVNDLLAYNSNLIFVRDATYDEDISKHFDKVLKNIVKNETFKVDVKSPSKYGDKYFWVEDYAVYAPDAIGVPRLGSIHGEADWMAWEMSNYWLFARRKYLLYLMNTKVDKSNPIIEPRAKGNLNKYLYKYRGRADRGDRCSLFYEDDLDKKHYRKIPLIMKEENKTENLFKEFF